VAEQKQEGFVTVEVKVTRGDLTPDQLRSLADITRTYAGGYARVTVQQNLVLRWVRQESVYDIWRALSELGLGDAGSREINDVVACPGTDSCKLGITSSMGLNQAVQERIEAMQITDELTRQIHIKMSGCPNGCAQHHVADIGFYGASIKVGEHTIPAYIPHVGGVYEGRGVAFGQRLKLRLPAKRVPEAIDRWLRHYESNRNDGEDWKSFVERVGTSELEGEVKDLSMPVDFGLETMNEFIDWNRDVPFQVIRGEGECAV
jgi:sulfite reductase beta subunit-like hemoprotein